MLPASPMKRGGRYPKVYGVPYIRRRVWRDKMSRQVVDNECIPRFSQAVHGGSSSKGLVCTIPSWQRLVTFDSNLFDLTGNFEKLGDRGQRGC